jgi:ribosomal-protein-alanine N-acetyltransferase
MIKFFSRLLHGEPVLAEAGPRDAAKLAALHQAAFLRGWSEDEFERLLLDRSVLIHRATIGSKLVAFAVSRIVAGEAELLSIAVSATQRGRGLAGRLLDLHLRRLVGLGVRALFLEVDETNQSALKLYQRRHFRQVGRRQSYYQKGPRAASSALVLRRDLA